MYVPKKSGVSEDIYCVRIVQNNLRRGDGAVVLLKSFVTLVTGDTPVILSLCGWSGLQVALDGSVGYHKKTFKEVIGIGVYIKGIHESVHIFVGCFFGADVCMCLANIDPVRALVSRRPNSCHFKHLTLLSYQGFLWPSLACILLLVGTLSLS